MGELLNRGYQLEILHRLASVYPQRPDLPTMFGEMDNMFQVNATYLHEHGLIRAKIFEAINTPRSIGSAEITAKGLDFIQDDGGLGAILGVVTVRFDDATLKALIEAKIQASDAPAAMKDQLISTLRSLPSEALKTVTLGLIEKGLEGNAAVEWVKGLWGG